MSREEWLKANRCPHCIRKCRGGYETTRTYAGWKCAGFASKYNDMRPSEFARVLKGE